MAATHTFVITSVTTAQNIATIVGSVDTIPSTGVIPVTCTTNYGDLIAVYTSGGLSLLETYTAALMVQAAITPLAVIPPAVAPPTLPVPAATTLAQFPGGTFSLNGNTYVTSPASIVGNTTTFTGTVNGTAVAVTVPLTRLLYTYTLGIPVFESVVAQQMLQAAYAAGLVQTTVTQLPTGTFTL